MRMRASALALAAAVGSAALPAHAKTIPQLVTANYSGVLDVGSIDSLGEFGSAGGDLSGMPFTATFALNERSPDFSSGYANGVTFASATGNASLTINGHVASFSNSYVDLDVVDFVNPGDYLYQGIADHTVQLSNSYTAIYELNLNEGLWAYFAGSTDYHYSPLSGFAFDTPTSLGYFDTSSQFFRENLGLLASSLMVTSVRAPKPLNTPSGISFSNAGLRAVPEPAGWAMMLVGIGALGAIARRRRSVAAV
jgi:hypothetical protein